MTKGIIVSINQNKQLEFPPDIQQQLNPGDEYLVRKNEDVIMLKKISSTLTLDKLQEKIISLGQDETWMSEEEVNQVKNVKNNYL
ncbi:hypothetical protein ACN4EE_07780 [Geminocystis sp. CENA526]|uniref:hypothetical protein n=1 Tax=Geminocystis sp. CENA526 TaxID=1355871 RepID=UPI003D6E1202